jgi:hypothetical protein
MIIHTQNTFTSTHGRRSFDIIEIRMGILNPLFPLLLAIGLAIVFAPWYVGVFWASAAFKVLGIPVSLKKVLTPRRFLAKAMERAGKI